MKFDKIKNTVTWKYLSKNPKFEELFDKEIKKYTYYVSLDELNFDITDKKIIISCESGIKNRDLDCQFKLYNQAEFSLEDNNYLMINELSGKLESNYGYDFQNTLGGRLNTNYSCEVYDTDGIELSNQMYSDQYTINKETFDEYKDDLSKVIQGIYNPNLVLSVNKKDTYTHPSIIGNNGNYSRQMRTNDNLGIIEVSKYSFDKNSQVDSVKEELYFNTFYGNKASYTPDLMHILRGYPFAMRDENNKVLIRGDYIKLGLTNGNYQIVARERFLKELFEQRERYLKDQQTLDKYSIMIEKLEKEMSLLNKML